MNDGNAIYARHLVREYAPDRGVCGLDLDVGWGECFALLGRNGSGKSTLTRLLLGMERPDAGELVVSGVDLVRRPRGYRMNLLRTVGVALDTSVHWTKLSGRSNAWFVAATYRLTDSEIEKEIDRLFGLADLTLQADDSVSNYSFGMKRKLSIAEALCHDPHLLVLDEPTSGIDAHFSDRLLHLISERSRNGHTTWIAGNDPEWVAEAATRVAFMDNGRIVAIGTVEELLAEVSPYQEIRVQLEGAVLIPAPNEPKLHTYEQNDDRVTMLVQEDPQLVPQMMEWIVSRGGVIRSVEVKRSTLRDAFLLKTGKELDQ